MKEKLVTKQNENLKLEKEFQFAKDLQKKLEKENKFLTEKNSHIKDAHEKSINDLKTEIKKCKTRFNFLQVEKKSFEEKYSKMAENYQKFFSKLNQNNQNLVFHKPANLDISNIVRKNDLIIILSKVNGTEKLIETIKNGYNESLRELLFENSALKNFILEINNEIIEYAIKLDLKGLVPLESNFINMPFLDAIPKFKYALKTNIKKSFDFWNLDNPNEFHHNANNEYNIPDSNIQNINNIINKKRDKISGIFFNNLNINSNDNLRNNKNFNINISNENNKNNYNIQSDSISLIREKNDNIFENEKLDNPIKENNFNKSILKINNDLNSFDQTNYDHMIDFDLDNFDLDDSNTISIKMNKRINFENKDKIGIDRGNGILVNIVENKNQDKKDSNFIDNELEYLKEKWMKALSG